MIKEKLENLVKEALKDLQINVQQVSMEHPDEISHGDYSTSVALAYSKQLKMKPRELAEKILAELEKNKTEFVEKMEVAGPGFINFHLSREFFANSVSEIVADGENFGKNSVLTGKKVMV